LTPLLIGLVEEGMNLISHLFFYRSNNEAWGFKYFYFIPCGDLICYYFGKIGKLGASLIIGITFFLGLLQLQRQRWNYNEVLILSFATFLIFAPGFGVQYLIYLAPFYAIFSVTRGMLYSLTAGIFVAAAYYSFLAPGFPLASFHGRTFPSPVAQFGLFVWISIAVLTWGVVCAGLRRLPT
jgi:hypothetical protein